MLTKKLEMHVMTHVEPLPTTDGHMFVHLHLGFGGTRVLTIYGDTRPDDSTEYGYPSLSINDAHAFAAELALRWNNYDAVKAALLKALENGGV